MCDVEGKCPLVQIPFIFTVNFLCNTIDTREGGELHCPIGFMVITFNLHLTGTDVPNSILLDDTTFWVFIEVVEFPTRIGSGTHLYLSNRFDEIRFLSTSSQLQRSAEIFLNSALRKLEFMKIRVERCHRKKDDDGTSINIVQPPDKRNKSQIIYATKRRRYRSPAFRKQIQSVRVMKQRGAIFKIRNLSPASRSEIPTLNDHLVGKILKWFIEFEFLYCVGCN